MKKLRLSIPYIFTILGIILIYFVVPNTINPRLTMLTQQDIIRPEVNKLLFIPYLIILTITTILTIVFSAKQFKTKKGVLLYNVITLILCFALAYLSKLVLFV